MTTTTSAVLDSIRVTDFATDMVADLVTDFVTDVTEPYLPADPARGGIEADWARLASVFVD